MLKFSLYISPYCQLQYLANYGIINKEIGWEMFLLYNKINSLIEEGIRVKCEEYHDVKQEDGLFLLPYIAGDKYNLWMNKIKILTENQLKNHPLYDEIIKTFDGRNNDYGTAAYDRMMSYLKALLDEYANCVPVSTDICTCETKKIFISHSSKDIEYINAFIKLLERIGFAGRGGIFCSSVSGYYIPNGQSIYEYLKKEIENDTHVIMFLSDNYYKSPACLNEMGATWIKAKQHTAILLPNFGYQDIKGAIDPSKIWFKMNDKERLNDFKDQIIEEFELNELDNNIWERIRDEYLDAVSALSKSQKNNVQRVEVEDILDLEESIHCIFRFINTSKSVVVCKDLRAIITDENNNDVLISVKYPVLREHKLYGLENKRIIIDVPKSQIDNYDQFDFCRITNWKTDTYWSPCME